MVVDDHEELCELIINILEFEFPNYQFIPAFSGTEAIEKFVEYKPDLALIDMHLRDMNGHNLALKMRALRSDFRIILVTAYSPNEVGDVANIVNGFVGKPLYKDTLLKTVREVLQLIP